MSVFRIGVMTLLLGVSGAATSEDRHVIICGSGGEAEYIEKFDDWGGRLRGALTEVCGTAPENVTLLTERGDGAAQSTLENIEAVFRALAEQSTAEDRLFVYLAGHGSFRRDVSKLMIPGPDLSANALDALLDAIPVKECAVLNTASAGAGFINTLSAPGRILCSATKSIEERNATEFMAFFIEALETGGADQDRDGRISMLEACTHAAALTEAWYAGEHLIATEHAILDDDGDGFGTRLPITETEGDGALAAVLYLKDYTFAEGTPPERIEAYRVMLAAVEAHIGEKVALEETAYYKKLERLLVKAARANQVLREGEGEEVAEL